MPQQTAFESYEAVLCRLEPLPAQFAAAIASSGPEAAGTIHGMLERIGRALDVDHVFFEDMDDSRSSASASHLWRRPHSSGDEPVMQLPVLLQGIRFGVLTVGVRNGLISWPLRIKVQLEALANLIVLATRYARQASELERVTSQKRPLSEAEAPARRDDDLADDRDGEDIVGNSPRLRAALARVHEAAATEASVVLLGETGTGKELFARAVHKLSARRARRFVRVNCAALPHTLIDSELFGHERGAFTGAVAMRRGCFELAHEGTIFLDEIGDLSPEVQARLLRVLEEGEFERLGSSQSRRVDVRIVAATHHDLKAAVKDRRFREDLYDRLNVFPIALPPLRERLEDIPRLVWFFVNQRQRALNRKFTKIQPSVFAALQAHSWPGNVRELYNVVERAMIHSTGDTLRLDDAPDTVWPHALRDDDGRLETVERRHIEQALRRSRWRINGPGNAAETLGLHPNTLRFRMKKLGIKRPVEIRDRRAPRRLSA